MLRPGRPFCLIGILSAWILALGTAACFAATPVPGSPGVSPSIPVLNFAPRVDYAVDIHPVSIDAADFNGDGILDLVTANDNICTVNILLGRGDGTFQPATRLPAPFVPRRVYARDFNKDGKMDLFVLSFLTNFSIYLGRGDGSFEEPVQYSAGIRLIDCAIADLNGDGCPDVAVCAVDPGHPSSLCIWLGSKSGRFTEYRREKVDYLPGWAYLNQAIVCSDFDGDGCLDLLCRKGDLFDLALLRGNGDGSFKTPVFKTPLGVEGTPGPLTSGDFNGDGFPDLAFAFGRAKPRIEIYLNDGHGHFRDGAAYPLSSPTEFLTATDLNRDGRLDLLSLGEGSYIKTLLGNGDGTFREGPKIPFGGGPTAAVVADFNRDGNPDIAVTDLDYGAVGVLLQSSEERVRPTWFSPKPGLTIASLDGIERSRNWIGVNFTNRTWTTEQDLPQNVVQCLQQTSDGYLWIGTQDGLDRFDGHRDGHIHFNRSNIPEMENDNCWSLAEDTQTNLWVGTGAGLLRKDRHGWQRLPIGPVLGSEKVQRLCASRRGGMWIGLDRGLVFYDGTQFIPIRPGGPQAQTGLPFGLYEDELGQSFCLASDGVVMVTPPVNKEKLSTRIASISWPIRAITGGSDGDLWLGGYYGEVTRLKAGVPELFEWSRISDKHYTAGPVKSLLRDPSGSLWIGGAAGLWLWRGQELIRDEQWGNQVVALLRDREESIWVAREGSGLAQIRTPRLRLLNATQGLPADQVSCAEVAAKDGSLWFGTRQGLSRFKDGVMQNFTRAQGLVTEIVNAIYEDTKGRVWYGGDHGGVGYFHNGGFVKCGPDDEATVRGIYEDSQGRIWVTTDWYVSFYEQGERKVPDNSVLHDSLFGFVEDRQHRILLGTPHSGLVIYTNGAIMPFSTEATKTRGLMAPLFEDQAGALWLVCANGLGRLKDGTLKVITGADGLADTAIMQVTRDDDGNFWVGANHGIYKVAKSDLDAVADGNGKPVRCVLYDTADGLPSTECMGFPGTVPRKDSEGRFWFATRGGAVGFDPRELGKVGKPPPVMVEEVKARDRIVFDNTGQTLSAGTVGKRKPANRRQSGSVLQLAPEEGNGLLIRYTAASFVAPQKIKFSYRLEGKEAVWTGARNQRSVFYPYLSPGNYTFHVKACDHHGVWNEDGALFAFSILPHFYQTWLFYVACGLAFFGVVGGVQAYRLSVQRRFLQLQQQHALELERSRLARDMHDDIGASLAKITLLRELARQNLGDSAAARSNVERISATAGEVAENIGDLVWATNPKFDTAESLAAYLREYAATFFADSGIRARLDFPESVPLLHLNNLVRRNLFLVLKESLANVAKHSQATTVEVTCTISEESLTLTIADNGKGFQETEVRKFSNGLINLRQRMEEIGGVFEISSVVGKGTRVRASLRLKPGRVSR